MPRCNDCNKFVSIESEGDPELNIDTDGHGNVSGSVRIVNECAECGSELTSATFDVTIDLTKEVEEHIAEMHGGKEVEWELDNEDASRTDRYDGKGRRAPHMYGVEVSVDLVCKVCAGHADLGERFEIHGTFSDEIQASAMDEA